MLANLSVAQNLSWPHLFVSFLLPLYHGSTMKGRKKERDLSPVMFISSMVPSSPCRIGLRWHFLVSPFYQPQTSLWRWAPPAMRRKNYGFPPLQVTSVKNNPLCKLCVLRSVWSSGLVCPRACRMGPSILSYCQL